MCFLVAGPRNGAAYGPAEMLWKVWVEDFAERRGGGTSGNVVEGLGGRFAELRRGGSSGNVVEVQMEGVQRAKKRRE